MGYNVNSEWKSADIVKKCSLLKTTECNIELIDPQVCWTLQGKYTKPCLVVTAGYDVTSNCKPNEDNTEEFPNNQPETNSSECPLSESIKFKYREETCFPNGEVEVTFTSLIIQCVTTHG